MKRLAVRVDWTARRLDWRQRVKAARHVLAGRPLIWRATLGPVVLPGDAELLIADCTIRADLDPAPVRARQAAQRVAEQILELLEDLPTQVQAEMRGASTGLLFNPDFQAWSS